MNLPPPDGDDDVTRSMASLVVVHGIGAQRRAESLLEWSEPLLRRMDWISRQNGGGGVQFGAVTLSDAGRDQVGARVAYRDLEGGARELYLTVTEARWSESFLALKTGEILTWAVAFVWRAAVRLGAHYSRVLWLDPWWRVLSAPFIAVFWVALVALTGLVTLLLPVLAVLVFVPFVSSLVHSAVTFLAEVAGDVAVWERRPVRAAAMRAVVRDELRAARVLLDTGSAKAGIPPEHTLLVVVAHSQGAAIVAETLFSRATGEPRVPVDALLTAGAAVTVLGASRGSAARAGEARACASRMGNVSAAFGFNPVEEWAALEKPPRWLNFWAIWDPFAAGPISTSARDRAERWRESYRRESRQRRRLAAPLGPEEHPVHNTALPFTDHQTYSANIAQVIDPMARLLLGIAPPLDRAAGAPGDSAVGARADSAAVTRRRAIAHVRSVKDLGVNRILALALAVASVVAPLVPLVDQPLLARVVIAVGIAIVALWINGTLWRAHVACTSWSSADDPPRGVWVAGLVVRIVLVTLLWFALRAAIEPVDERGCLLVIAALAGVLAVVAPYLGRVPAIVPERR
jgi:hypothetical protein